MLGSKVAYSEYVKLQEENKKLKELIQKLKPWDALPDYDDDCLLCGESSHKSDCEYLIMINKIKSEDN